MKCYVFRSAEFMRYNVATDLEPSIVPFGIWDEGGASTMRAFRRVGTQPFKP